MITEEEIRGHVALLRYQLRVLEACHLKAAQDYYLISKSADIIEEMLKEMNKDA